MLDGKISLKENLSDKCVVPVKAGDLFQDSVSGNRISNLFSSAFQELHAYKGDTVDEEIGDIQPPGCEKNSRTYIPQFKFKYRPSRVVESVPKMTKYVATALCRQKLHDEVLEKWKSLFLDAAFNQLFMSLCPKKKISQPDSHAVRIGSFNIQRNSNADLADFLLLCSPCQLFSRIFIFVHFDLFNIL